MDLKIDANKFDNLQEILIGGIIDGIKAELDAAHLPSDQARDLLEKISFSVAAILDGSRSVELDGVEPNPVVTFGESTSLISAGGNSWMHEYVFGIIGAIYSE